MKTSDYLKAIRRADRETSLQLLGKWTQITKVHRSKKTYSRKLKHNNEIE